MNGLLYFLSVTFLWPFTQSGPTPHTTLLHFLFLPEQQDTVLALYWMPLKMIATFLTVKKGKRCQYGKIEDRLTGHFYFRQRPHTHEVSTPLGREGPRTTDTIYCISDISVVAGQRWQSDCAASYFRISILLQRGRRHTSFPRVGEMRWRSLFKWHVSTSFPTFATVIDGYPHLTKGGPA